MLWKIYIIFLNFLSKRTTIWIFGKRQFFLIINIKFWCPRRNYFNSSQSKIGYGWYFLHVKNWCVNYCINFDFFHEKNTVNYLRRKHNDRKTLTKHVPPKSHLVIANFRILKCWKEYKRTKELTTYGRIFTEMVIFASGNPSGAGRGSSPSTDVCLH